MKHLKGKCGIIISEYFGLQNNYQNPLAVPRVSSSTCKAFSYALFFKNIKPISILMLKFILKISIFKVYVQADIQATNS